MGTNSKHVSDLHGAPIFYQSYTLALSKKLFKRTSLTFDPKKFTLSSNLIMDF